PRTGRSRSRYGADPVRRGRGAGSAVRGHAVGGRTRRPDHAGPLPGGPHLRAEPRRHQPRTGGVDRVGRYLRRRTAPPQRGGAPRLADSLEPIVSDRIREAIPLWCVNPLYTVEFRALACETRTRRSSDRGAACAAGYRRSQRTEASTAPFPSPT